MAKINLITRHSGESYGAVFQTYATCMILRSLGHRVTIINLIEKDRVQKYFSPRNLKSYPKYINFWIFKWRNYPRRTRLMTKIDKTKIPQADYTIVGSDQVWNPQVTKDNKLSYFLDFAQQTQRLSLASSFGKGEWAEKSDYTEKVKNCLYTFKAISVRESSGVDICKSVFGLDASCVIDPTIAWGKYDTFIRQRPINQIGVFLLLPNNPIFPVFADTLSERTGAKIKMLDYYGGNKYEHINNFQKSPVRWLNEIYNSKFIITDSFHGVAFSLIFKKQFFVICADEKKFTRIMSLLTKVGLADRVILDEENISNQLDTLMKPIAYTDVDEILKKERENYYSFVKKNING